MDAGITDWRAKRLLSCIAFIAVHRTQQYYYYCFVVLSYSI